MLVNIVATNEPNISQQAKWGKKNFQHKIKDLSRFFIKHVINITTFFKIKSHRHLSSVSIKFLAFSNFSFPIIFLFLPNTLFKILSSIIKYFFLHIYWSFKLIHNNTDSTSLSTFHGHIKWNKWPNLFSISLRLKYFQFLNCFVLIKWPKW